MDTVIAAIEASDPNLTTQKTLYVEISRGGSVLSSSQTTRRRCGNSSKQSRASGSWRLKPWIQNG